MIHKPLKSNQIEDSFDIAYILEIESHYLDHIQSQNSIKNQSE